MLAGECRRLCKGRGAMCRGWRVVLVVVVLMAFCVVGELVVVRWSVSCRRSSQEASVYRLSVEKVSVGVKIGVIRCNQYYRLSAKCSANDSQPLCCKS